MKILSIELKTNNYGSEPMLGNCGISISIGFTEAEARVLPTPRYLSSWVMRRVNFSNTQHDSDVLVAPISLGKANIGCVTKFTLAKRKLYSEFLSCQAGSSSSEVKSAAVLEGGYSVKQLSGLVAMKIENE